MRNNLTTLSIARAFKAIRRERKKDQKPVLALLECFFLVLLCLSRVEEDLKVKH